MKRTATLIALVAATPALAHHEAHTTMFSSWAAVAALSLIAATVFAAPHVRDMITRVTAR